MKTESIRAMLVVFVTHIQYKTYVQMAIRGSQRMQDVSEEYNGFTYINCTCWIYFHIQFRHFEHILQTSECCISEITLQKVYVHKLFLCYVHSPSVRLALVPRSTQIIVSASSTTRIPVLASTWINLASFHFSSLFNKENFSFKTS